MTDQTIIVSSNTLNQQINSGQNSKIAVTVQFLPEIIHYEPYRILKGQTK